MKNDSVMQLYSYYRSSASYRVRMALHLKNLEFEYKPVHLLQNGGEQFSENYRALNPLATVPTLVHQGRPLSQSMAILEYLDEAFPETMSLFPKDLYLRGRVRQVCENFNSGIQPYHNLKLLNYLEQQFSFSVEQKKVWNQKWITDGLAATEKLVSLTAKDYAFGNEITAADVFIVAQAYASHRLEVDINQYPNLAQINQRMLKLKPVQKAHPDQQIDSP